MDAYEKTRIEVLLNSRPGSPLHMIGLELDQGCPRFAPRGPSPKEEETLQKVGETRQWMAEFMAQRAIG